MQTIKNKSQVRVTTQAWKREGLSVALVPTMGNLHDGHLKLVEHALQHADKVVVSIVVTPIQIGEHEDFDSYPRTLDRDSALLAEHGVDLLFAPEVSEIYADQDDQLTQVCVPGLSEILCGSFRPGHFAGVTTIVAKLFNIVQPDLAVFGEKDYQQLFLIRKMVLDLDYPVKILGLPTVREQDGLAMSSRNSYLSQDERQRASLLSKMLAKLKEDIRQGDREYIKLQENAHKILEKYGFSVDYVDIRNAETLHPAQPHDIHIVLLVAARLGATRLIDNMTLDLSDIM